MPLFPSADSTRPTDLRRRTFLRRLLGGGVLLGGSSLAAGVAQGYRFGVVQQRWALAGLNRPVRVALLTDLHYGLYIEAGSVRRWVDATLAERPELILLGGDLLDRTLAELPSPLLTELGRLKAPLGVYAVWGNHDYGSFGRYSSGRRGAARSDWQERRARFQNALAAQGITVLLNEGRAVRADLWLGGVDDLWHGQPDAEAALRGAAAKQASVLLSHNPDVLLNLAARPGLVLSGHTHGGQVRLPLVGAVTVPADPRFTMGWVRGPQGIPAYVSRGLGMSGVPLRNLCPAEITLLTLLPQGVS